MNRHEIAYLRLINQHLSHKSFRSPAKLVDSFGTVMASSLSQATWALASRLAGEPTHDLIRECLEQREIVRSWLLRGNMSLVTPQDLPWLLDYSAPRAKKVMAKQLEDLELTPTVLLAAQDLIFRNLKQEGGLSSSALFLHLNRGGIETEGKRGHLILMMAAMDKLVFCGLGEGSDTVFELYDDWIPSTSEKTEEEILAELALRYFASRGPATLIDFAWYCGLKPEEAKLAVELIQTSLVRLKSDEKIYLMASHVDASAKLEDVLLLPAYDEYLMSYWDHKPILDPRYQKDLQDEKTKSFLPLIVSRGEIIGTWRIEAAEQGFKLRTKPFRPFSEEEERSTRDSAMRYISFMTSSDRPSGRESH